MFISSRYPRISLIAAISTNDRGIARNGAIPWKITDDLKRFKSLTTSHALLMGRKTFQSAGCFPLAGRENVVLTRDKSFAPEGARVIYGSFWDAMTVALDFERSSHKLTEQEMFVIGGEQIYRQALPFASRVYITLVDSNEPCDQFFPEYELLFKEPVSEWSRGGLHSDGYGYSYLTLDRL
jgi:dihydrofolate reductase